MKFFRKKYRVVRDKFSGFEVQAKRWWFPIWVQCCPVGTLFGGVNTHHSLDSAKEFIEKKKTEVIFKKTVVLYSE